MYQTYSIFDTCIRSEIPLPELPACAQSASPITIKRIASGQINVEGFHTRHEWLDGDRLICTTARRNADCLLSFPQQADFYIQPNGDISCVPVVGVEQDIVRQLLLNQVLPRYLAHTGELVVHASAVTLPDGRTVAFLGESGYGKSTLASFCHQQGAQIIDDDCILLRSGRDGQVSIIGGVPTIRLNPDSLRALSHDPAVFAPYVGHADKRQMRLADGSTSGSVPRRLDALFLLDAPADALAANTVCIEPAAGQAAVKAIIGSTFSLDPSDHTVMTSTFSRVALMLREGLSVHHLQYPREHAKLPQVLQALLKHKAG